MIPILGVGVYARGFALGAPTSPVFFTERALHQGLFWLFFTAQVLQDDLRVGRLN